jgi:heat shock protein HslJ
MRWIITIVIACAVAAGCESGRDQRGAASLVGTSWRLTAWPVSSAAPPLFTITAEFSESQISGSSAVNSYGGQYTATSDGRFSVGEMQSTLMGGSEDAMRAEALYFELLQQARKYEATRTTLTLKDGNNQAILIFTAR